MDVSRHKVNQDRIHRVVRWMLHDQTAGTVCFMRKALSTMLVVTGVLAIPEGDRHSRLLPELVVSYCGLLVCLSQTVCKLVVLPVLDLYRSSRPKPGSLAHDH